VVSSALRDDVIGRFLAEVDKEVCLVKKHNTEIEFTKMGSRKKVAGIYTHVLERYHKAFPWLKPHFSSYYKAREKKETMAKAVSAKKENRLALAKAALTSTSTSASDYDCSSANATAGTGTGNNESTCTVSAIMCRKEGRAVEHLRKSKGKWEAAAKSTLIDCSSVDSYSVGSHFTMDSIFIIDNNGMRSQGNCWYRSFPSKQ
jgi:hypothetical protein